MAVNLFKSGHGTVVQCSEKVAKYCWSKQMTRQLHKIKPRGINAQKSTKIKIGGAVDDCAFLPQQIPDQVPDASRSMEIRTFDRLSFHSVTLYMLALPCHRRAERSEFKNYWHDRLGETPEPSSFGGS